MRFPARFVLASLVCLLCLLACTNHLRADDSAPVRAWKDSTGRYEVKASLVKHENNSVYLKRAKDGKIVEVPYDRLSTEDRKYLEDLQAGNPFSGPSAAPNKAISAAAQSLVVVAREYEGTNRLQLGYVFRRDKAHAYVAIQPMGSFPRTVGVQPAADPGNRENFTIYWGEPKRRKVAAEVVARYQQKRLWILRAPADQLPSPLAGRPDANVTEGSAIHVLGYELDHGTPTPSFSKVSLTAIGNRIFRSLEGDVTKVGIQHSSNANLTGCLAFNDQGELLGIVAQARPAGDPPSKGSAVIMPATELMTLGAPEFSGVYFAPKAGDRKSIHYQFVAKIEDPFGKAKSPRLLVHPILDQQPTAIDRVSEPLEDAKTLVLTKRKPDDVVLLQIPGGEFTNTYVADLTTANPGPLNSYRMKIQVAYEDASGQTIYTPKRLISYNPSNLRRAMGRSGGEEKNAMPDIPGMDGKPLDMPRVVAHKDGGYLLTSALTRVENQTAPNGSLAFPKPVKSDESLAGGEKETPVGKSVDLQVPAQVKGSHSRSRAPMVFSKDGKYLYLIDGNYAVHKVETETLVGKAALETGIQCDHMSISKAGVVIVSNSSGEAWVLDKKSLEVQRSISIPGAKLVAGNPTTTIGFMTSSSKGAYGNGISLHMVDFGTGKILHTLKSRYKNYVVSVNNTRPFDELFLGIQMSADGKRLFSANRSIQRFRVDGEDLIYEEKGRGLQSGHTTHFALSVDDKWVAMPTGGGNGGGYNIVVYSASDLTTEKLDLKNGAYPCAIGWDPKSGKIYAPNHDEMNVFTDRGGKVTSFPHGLRDPRRIIVHPQGERFVVWSSERIVLHDVR